MSLEQCAIVHSPTSDPHPVGERFESSEDVADWNNSNFYCRNATQLHCVD
ncbi:hypothetical protein AM1_5119 [Acaryochloris marina MBIC11017]|uniref:Uncharacterized protein n=1 Tax=Acaryochloris marina (strain MBIC 11017) TaxID=329726 RepID=B0C7A5_ACAM1|nr:hypothetical protein AM1_5119 [Acaryochloris marina MBIC11017]